VVLGHPNRRQCPGGRGLRRGRIAEDSEGEFLKGGRPRGGRAKPA